jgi:flagellar basal body-associated protein FliL
MDKLNYVYNIEHFGIKSYPIGRKCKKNSDCASSYCDKKSKKCNISKGGKIALIVAAAVLTGGIGGVALGAAGAAASVEMDKADKKKEKQQKKKKQNETTNATTIPQSDTDIENDEDYEDETNNSFFGNLFNSGTDDETETGEDDEETDTKSDNENKGLPIYGIVLIVIGCLGVVGLIFYFLFKNKKVAIKYPKLSRIKS